MRYYIKTFDLPSDVVAWFNDPQNSDKELISVCASSSACYDRLFYAYYEIKNGVEHDE